MSGGADPSDGGWSISGSLRKGYTDGKRQKEKTGQDLLAHDSSIQQTGRHRCSRIVTVLLIYFAKVLAKSRRCAATGSGSTPAVAPISLKNDPALTR